MLYIPYAVQNIRIVDQRLSKNLIEAAQISGSKGWTLFRTITFPLLRPGIISGWILIFCISMRELVASLMLRPPNTDTSSTFIYRQFEQGVCPRYGNGNNVYRYYFNHFIHIRNVSKKEKALRVQ